MAWPQAKRQVPAAVSRNEIARGETPVVLNAMKDLLGPRSSNVLHHVQDDRLNTRNTTHIRLQYLRHRNTAIGLLVIFKNRHQGPADR